MTLLAVLTRLRTNNLKGLSTTLTLEQDAGGVIARTSSLFLRNIRSDHADLSVATNSGSNGLLSTTNAG
jgi:hypothetical protein